MAADAASISPCSVSAVPRIIGACMVLRRLDVSPAAASASATAAAAAADESKRARGGVGGHWREVRRRGRAGRLGDSATVRRQR
jgi:hypothetical protein